ncbi:MAG: J domain-containing protein [Clostridia bacterium]|nr:J domain-containing protein [Clostridia bacterium]
MKDPYEVLGVPRGCDREKVKAAYRELAKKYHPDQYAGSPLADLANEKMQEINEAYDAILSGNAGSSYGSSGSGYAVNDYSAVENYINRGAFDEAERILEGINERNRDAHWYYLKGELNYRRGWTQQAYSYYSMAYNMQPNNPIYKDAFMRASQNRSGGFRTGHTQHHGHGSLGDCDGCDICTGLMCADCCCECFGGDLISCC